jgi:RNA polymerase sigma-70 factor (ECF subfamily)
VVDDDPAGVDAPRRPRQWTPPAPEPHRTGDEDRAAFAELYRADITRLVGFLMSAYGADADEAWDAAQTAFARAWQHWSSIHTSPRAWLRTTAHRVFLRQVPDRHDRLGRAVPDRPDVALTPEQIVLLTDSTARLRDLFQALPPAQRVALALQLDGFTYPEIAEIVDQKEGAVRQNVSRAKARIRSRLEGGTR